MYAQDDLTAEIEALENSEGFYFTNAPNVFEYAEVMLARAYINDYLNNAAVAQLD